MQGTRCMQDPGDRWEVDGFFIERTSYERGVRMLTMITVEQIREAMALLKRDPTPAQLWLTGEDHGEKGVTGVDGYVWPILRYWQQHPDPPEDVRTRLRAREAQEAEQRRERDKKANGKGGSIWKQALLPARAPSPDKDAWMGAAVRRPRELPVTCRLTFPDEQVQTFKVGRAQVEYRKASAVLREEGKDRWMGEL